MNKIFIIGSLVRDPETRTTASGKTVCSFVVAVNRRGDRQQEADYFRVAAWQTLGELCQKYLSKGRKVCVIGSISAHAYMSQNNEAKAQMDVMASEVEFLTPKGDAGTAAPASTQDDFTPVDDADLPF